MWKNIVSKPGFKGRVHHGWGLISSDKALINIIVAEKLTFTRIFGFKIINKIKGKMGLTLVPFIAKFSA